MDNLARSLVTLVVAISFLVAPGQVMLQLLSNVSQLNDLVFESDLGYFVLYLLSISTQRPEVQVNCSSVQPVLTSS